MTKSKDQSEHSDVLLGVFPGESERLQRIRAFQAWLTRPLDVVTTFIRTDAPASYRQEFLKRYLPAIVDAGFVPLLTWEPFGFETSSYASPVRSINEGRVDDEIHQWAKLLREWLCRSSNGKVIFRPAHEMNGTWYPWSAGHGTTPEEYTRMWRRLFEAFSNAGVPRERVDWMWCINVTTGTRVDPFEYFPGEQYVDWIGVDGYNFGDSQSWSSWQSPEAVFEQTLAAVNAETNLPLAIPETGCSSAYNGGRRPTLKSQWLVDAFELFEKHGVELVGWFNMAKETDWPVLEPVSSDTAIIRQRTELNGRQYDCYPRFKQASSRHC
ncbi:glycoside hydrolase family 26 protein [Salinigranum halophilum]|uniref:glycoside hydrolase family 26 protein n=1 Tax=Salinigranum halophilum TaxID=2565931 RepID=UPI0010A8B391|nr:glycosyl hydrolase [Salinigranum halophilum]